MAHGEAVGRPLPCARAAAARLPHLCPRPRDREPCSVPTRAAIAHDRSALARAVPAVRRQRHPRESGDRM